MGGRRGQRERLNHTEKLMLPDPNPKTFKILQKAAVDTIYSSLMDLKEH